MTAPTGVPFDAINGLFELAGAALVLLNVRALWRDRVLRGVHWGPTVFFTAWGLWNLVYYPSLSQWWSFAGGLALVIVNALWLGLLMYLQLRAEHDAQTRWFDDVIARGRQQQERFRGGV